MESLTIFQLENCIQMEFYQNDLDTIVQSTKYNREILKQTQTTSVYSILYTNTKYLDTTKTTQLSKWSTLYWMITGELSDIIFIKYKLMFA